MSKPRKKLRARKGSRGRTYTISCTDEQWAPIQDGADRAGKSVSAWFVDPSWHFFRPAEPDRASFLALNR